MASPPTCARRLAETFGILAIAGVLLLAFGLTSTQFLAADNIRNIFVQISVVGVAAIGETIVMLAGGLDLSVGSVVLLSEVICADLTTTYHLPLGIALLAALGAAGAIGLLNGVLVAVIGIEPILATLGTLLVAAGLAKLILGLRYLAGRQPHLQRPRRDQRPLQSADHGRGDARALPRRLGGNACLPVRPHGLRDRRQPARGARVGPLGGRDHDRRLRRGGQSSPGSRASSTSRRSGSSSQNDGLGLEFSAIIAALVGGLSVTTGGVGRVERTLLGALIVGMMINYQTIKGVDPAFQQAFLGGLLVAAVLADRLLRGRQ